MWEMNLDVDCKNKETIVHESNFTFTEGLCKFGDPLSIDWEAIWILGRQ